MVLDVLDNSVLYEYAWPGFEEAFAFLRDTDLAGLPEGRHEIDGDRVYAIVAVSQGRGREKSPLEAHREYIDIQVTLAGHEIIGWRPVPSCTVSGGYDVDNDVELFDDSAATWLPVDPGFFAVFFPGDAHAPLAGAGEVRKVVVKVEVE